METVNELWWLGVFKQLTDGGFVLMKVLHRNISEARAEKRVNIINIQLGHERKPDGTFIVDDDELFVMIDTMGVCPN